MHNIQSIYQDCYNKVVDLGIVPGNIIGVSINKRFSRCYGKCITMRIYDRSTRETVELTHTIEIAGFLINDNVPLSCIENTMFHEILHTCKDCQNHGKNWQYYASMINRAYGQHVGTYATTEEMKYAPKRKTPTQPKWTITCDDCGKEWFFTRKKPYFNYLNLCKCNVCNTHHLSLTQNH